MARNAKRERKRLEYEREAQSKIERTHDPGPGMWHIGENVLVAVPSPSSFQKMVKLGDPARAIPSLSGPHNVAQSEDEADSLLSEPPRKRARVEGGLEAVDATAPIEQRLSLTANAELLLCSESGADEKAVIGIAAACIHAIGQVSGPHNRQLSYEQRNRETDRLLSRPVVSTHKSGSVINGPQSALKGPTILSTGITVEHPRQIQGRHPLMKQVPSSEAGT
ncbi:hypothetical protein AOQ84DRAFT_407785 [Glonium stellatum]|uniref:Uncharacterized protein n=1 Tax=Glonium stellatum TaxID=574774 RepID=A0A8E2FE20_9PEZI|nr:hypothetical protein AOQ84DRAFT_407785 [Glonium stellatum]